MVITKPDIPLAEAIFLYNAGWKGEEPAFAVRRLGHPYYDRYRFSVGACFSEWQQMARDSPPINLLAKAMIDIWHAAAFYAVPIDMIHEAMLVVPEYRGMLADDCLPKAYQHERY